MSVSLVAKIASACRFLREGAIQNYEASELRRRLPGVSIAHGVTIRTPARFSAGAGTRLEEGVYVNCGGDWSEQGGFSCGQDCFIGANSVIYAGGGVELGNHVALGPNVVLASHQHVEIVGPSPFMDKSVMRPVRLGHNVRVHMGAILLPGVTLGDNSSVAAGSVVTRDVPPNSLVMGSPARVVRQL